MKIFFVTLLSLFLIMNFACTKKTVTVGKDWSGTLTADKDKTTIVEEVTCENSVVATRTMYKYGAENCVSEKQTRTCKDNKWGDWSGTFTAYSCPRTNRSVLNQFF